MNILQMIELGLIHANEPAAAAAPAGEGGGDVVLDTGGGGAPSVGDAPVAPPVESVETPSASSDEWEGLAEEFEAEEADDALPVETPTGTPKAATTTPPKAAEPPKAPETPKAATAVPPANQPPAAQQPAQPPSAAEQNAAYVAELNKAHQELTEYYKLSEADVELLHTQPEVVIPQLAARMMIDMHQTITRSLHQVVPQIVMQAQERTRVSREAENAFDTAWPMLKGNRDVVMKLGQAYRNLYPTASREDFIRDVGAQAMVALKIPFDMRTGKPLAETQTPPKAPFRAPTARGATQPPQQRSEWDELAASFDDE